MEVSPNNYHFAGWVTCCDVPCSDGRTIMRDAFKHHDGTIVPLVWNHQHNDVHNVLGKMLLHSRDGSVYGYGLFNDTESGQAAKALVDNGDIVSLSICANQLKHNATRGVTHGMIREVSLVLAGANPGAFIDTVIKHGEDCDSEDEAIIYSGEEIVLFHSEDTSTEVVEEEVEETSEEETEETVTENVEETTETEEATDTTETTESTEITHSDEESAKEETTENTDDSESLTDIYNGLTDKQKVVLHYIAGELIKGDNSETTNNEESEGGDTVMKQNVFDQEDVKKGTTLTHSDMNEIIAMAKESGIGSFQKAAKMFVQNSETLAHGFVDGEDGLGSLFPDHQLLNPGAPELVRDYDQGWVMGVINKIKKSPYARVRTRHADARAKELEADYRAKGYNDRTKAKELTDKIQLLKRKIEPTTIYIKDELHRDDIIDITDFDVVAYNWNFMKENLYETLALAALIGDGRDALDENKINETNIIPIWKDNELYTHHVDVDIEAARKELQGSDTSVHFGENYIYAEAIITAALYAREKYKGSGTPDLHCTPHLVNVMLLARDLNGRRIYDSKADLARALNVNHIVEIEQFEGKTRTTEDGKTKKLLGLFVNLSDYQFGSAKGGEITKFEDFDIDFNKYKYLLETRLSGGLTKLGSAIALEEPVTEAAG